MGVTQVLERARELGINLRVEGGRIKYAPKALAPEDFIESLREHKRELMVRLRPSVVDASPQWHAERVARDTIQYGICLFWIEDFQEIIAFIRTEKLRDRVPIGIAIYTWPELKMLFPEKGQSVQKATLRLAHKAKKLAGARVIDFQVRRQERT